MNLLDQPPYLDLTVVDLLASSDAQHVVLPVPSLGIELHLASDGEDARAWWEDGKGRMWPATLSGA